MVRRLHRRSQFCVDLRSAASQRKLESLNFSQKKNLTSKQSLRFLHCQQFRMYIYFLLLNFSTCVQYFFKKKSDIAKTIYVATFDKNVSMLLFHFPYRILQSKLMFKNQTNMKNSSNQFKSIHFWKPCSPKKPKLQDTS